MTNANPFTSIDEYLRERLMPADGVIPHISGIDIFGDSSRMVQLLARGLQIPADHPDHKRYISANFRQREINSSDLAEITLMSPGDILVLYTDGVYDGSDRLAQAQLEAVMREHYAQSAQGICNADEVLFVSMLLVIVTTGGGRLRLITVREVPMLLRKSLILHLIVFC